MPVYKRKGRRFYTYEFEVGGHRFYGPTRCETRPEAKKVERAEREKVEQRLADQQGVTTSLQMDHVTDRYWVEVGQGHAGADNTERDLERLVAYFGKTRLLTEITNDDVAKLVAWRRGHRVREDGPLIANATVNRSTTEVLKKLFTRARLAWGVTFRKEPNWRGHMLPEPVERVRELHDDEAERLDAAMREDYAPLFDFARVTGLRQKEAVLLRWSEVNWGTRQIVKLGKGGKRVVVPITDAVREILWPLQGHHPEFVFTYVAVRPDPKQGRVRGERYPMTVAGLKTRWRRTRAAAGIDDFRYHDIRHDYGTKLLRETGNLKLVQKAMNHADLKTTSKYAHVLDEEVAAAVQRVAESRQKPRRTG